MTIRKKKYCDWIQPQLRKINVVLNLKKDVQRLRDKDMISDVRDIFVGSVCDSYQLLELDHELTRQILEVLIENELPFTLLTKSDLIRRDVDLLRNYKWCRAGITITSLDENFRKTLEPCSVDYGKRIDTLAVLKGNGISTYLSCEPIFPVKEANPIEIVQKTSEIVGVFEFGMWNKYRYKHLPKYYWQDYSDDYYIALFEKIIQYCEENKINYCIASHSKKFFEKYGLPFKPYPLVKDSL
jgi:DNA repair photolyase